MRDYVSVITDVRCEGRNFLRVSTVFVSWSNHYPSVKCLFFLLTDSYTVHCAGFSYHTRADFRLHQKTFISHLFHLHFFFFFFAYLSFAQTTSLPVYVADKVNTTTSPCDKALVFLVRLSVARCKHFLSQWEIIKLVETWSRTSMSDYLVTHTHIFSLFSLSHFIRLLAESQNRYAISEWCL